MANWSTQPYIDPTTKNIYELFDDYDNILGLTYVLPMMEVVQTLSKMA